MNPLCILRIDDLTLGYQRYPAVHHLSGCVMAGSMTAVIGPNGAGKSTLLKGLAGLMRPLQGHMNWCADITRRDIAYLPQRVELEPDFPITVLDAVSLGLWHRVGTWRQITPALRHEAVHALDTVGMAGFERRTLDTLSGGQFQRAMFARLSLQDARVLLLDEPFAAVDPRTVDDLLAIMARWHQEQRTLLVVLHDWDVVRRHFPDTLLLAREAVAWGNTTDVLQEAHVQRARALQEAWNEHAVPCHRGAAA
jgi:zinc/manganese transport system ATP-binding protein